VIWSAFEVVENYITIALKINETFVRSFAGVCVYKNMGDFQI
jgi:hypothetical protein